MRITNSMMQNMMLLNINRNSNKLYDLYEQQSSGKQISLPSDDPIAASRILRFRTNISENDQYQKNVNQANSWMDVSEQAFSNTISILTRIRELSVTGANDTLELSDREKITKEITSLKEQLGTEVNSTYAGRYIFSGYRTDREPTFTSSNDSEYSIKQIFEYKDMENIEAYQKFSKDDEGLMTNSNVLKIPYKNAENLEVTVDGNTIAVTIKSISEDTAYVVGDDEINYIKDTGELVIGKNISKALNIGPLEVNYEKKGFLEGEINPVIYFEVEDINPNSKEFGKKFEIDNHKMIYEVGVGVTIQVNNLGKNIFSDKLFSDLDGIIDGIGNLKISSRNDLIDKYKALGYEGKDLEDKVDEQITLEKSQLSISSQKRFSNMLEIMDNRLSKLSVEYTELGSRMSRLDLIEKRLSENGLTYTELLSKNEDVDFVELTMELMSVQSIYQASLKAGASIIQTTLLDFI